MSRVRPKLGPLTLDVPALIIGLQILAKGWEKLEGGHHPLLAPFLLVLGAAVVVAAFLTLWLEKRTGSGHAPFHIAEGTAMALSALATFEGDHLRIPSIVLLAGLAYLSLGVVEAQREDRKARWIGPLQKSLGAAFLLAGLALGVFTAFGDRSIAALITAAVLAILGLVLILLPRWIARSA